MTSLRPRRTATQQTLRVLLAGLCVLLILFIGAAQVLHTHASDEAANSGCSLCAVAHLSVLLAPVPARPVTAESVCPVRTPDLASAPPRFFSFSLYVRPPPALNAHA